MPADRVDRLLANLNDPHTFATALPIPSVSIDHGAFCKDMWRGPVWININYMTSVGLRRHGREADADALAEKTLAAIARWYRRTGCFYEFYDALDLTPPTNLDRKRRHQLGHGMACISDYNWTAAMTALLLYDLAE